MPALARFIRNTPVPDLRNYFVFREVDFPESMNWDEETNNVTKPLLRIVNELSDIEQARLRLDAERIDRMSDEIGQRAILALAPDRDLIVSLENAYARTLWLFINEPDLFRRAEEACFVDHARRGRTWDGFSGPKELAVSETPENMAALAEKVRGHFREGEKIKVDVFKRVRPGLDGEEYELVQVTIYREGLPNSFLVFEGDELERLVHKPVFEIALTYEPDNGVIEVIAKEKAGRAELAKIFAETLLEQKISGERIPLRHYDLSGLARPHDFPTDPEDGIESVVIRMLKLNPMDGSAFVTIEPRGESGETIYEASRRLFSERDPFANDYGVVRARISIRFRSDSVNPRGKTLTFNLSGPNGCDLKGKTEKERLIGEKYLVRWGLAEDL